MTQMCQNNRHFETVDIKNDFCHCIKCFFFSREMFIFALQKWPWKICFEQFSRVIFTFTATLFEKFDGLFRIFIVKNLKKRPYYPWMFSKSEIFHSHFWSAKILTGKKNTDCICYSVTGVEKFHEFFISKGWGWAG